MMFDVSLVASKVSPKYSFVCTCSLPPTCPHVILTYGPDAFFTRFHTSHPWLQMSASPTLGTNYFFYPFKGSVRASEAHPYESGTFDRE